MFARTNLLLSQRPHHCSLPTATDFSRNGGDFRGFSGFLSDPYSVNGVRLSRDLKQLQKTHASSFSTSSDVVSTLTKPAGGDISKTQNDSSKKDADNEIADTKILRSLGKQLLLNDSAEFRLRTLLALSLLVGAKVINVQVPIVFKLAIDWLSAITGSETALASFSEANSTMLALFVSPAAVLIGYGIARSGAAACNELRNAVFAKLALGAIRAVSRKVFAHLHELDLRYHLSRNLQSMKLKPEGGGGGGGGGLKDIRPP